MAINARIALGAMWVAGLVACTEGTIDLSDPEIIVSDASIQLDEDGQTQVVLAADDVRFTDETPIYEIRTPPVSGTLEGEGDQEGPGNRFTYLPNPDYNGQDILTWRARVGDFVSDEATITFLINSINDAPRGTADQIVTDEDTPVSESAISNDIEGDVLTFQIVDLPANGSVEMDATGEYTYTPDEDFFGDDSFLWAASDPAGASTGPVQVDVLVRPSNDRPVVQTVGFVTPEDTALDGQLTASDPEGDLLSYSVESPLQNGSLTSFNNATGAFTYQPDPNYFGPDSFTVKANDGLNDSPVTTVNITVTSVNDLPIVTSESITTDEDTAFDGMINAIDIEGDPLTYQLSNAPLRGTAFIDGPTGLFTYTPDPDFNGDDEFTVVASDPGGDSVPAVVSVVVNSVNDTPTVSSPGQLLTDEDTSVAATVMGNDVEGSPLIYSIATDAAHGTITLSESSGDFVYRPNRDYNGSDRFSVVAFDGEDASLPAFVDILVTPVNDPPVTEVAVLETLTGVPGTVTLVATDPEGSQVFFDIRNPPNNGSAFVDPITGELEYEPDPGFSGPDVVLWAASDGALESSGILAITVQSDRDGDEIGDDMDNCPDLPNPDQLDASNNDVGNDVGDLCDCYTQPFEEMLDSEFFVNSNLAIIVDEPVTSDSHSLRLTGDGSFVETTPVPGCGSILYSMQVGRGLPGPDIADVLVLSVRQDGGPWTVLREVFGTGMEESYLEISGQTSDTLDLSNSMVEFRLEVISDNLNDLFFIDDFEIACDEDSDGLVDCVEAELPGYNLLLANADGDGWDDLLEFENGTDPNNADTDFDGVDDHLDNCPTVGNPLQEDADMNNIGDICEIYIEDGFDNGVDLTIWTGPPSPNGDLTGVLAPVSPPNALRLPGTSSFMTSVPFDFSPCPAVAFEFQTNQGNTPSSGPLEYPDANEFLRLQYNDNGNWVDLYAEMGLSSSNVVWGYQFISTTAPAVLSTSAEFRFANPSATILNGDSFFVDDVRIGCDTDGDGIPDLSETFNYGTSRTSADTDGDGTPDPVEIQAGTNPLGP